MEPENTLPANTPQSSSKETGRHRFLMVLIIILTVSLLAALTVILFLLLRSDDKVGTTDIPSNSSAAANESDREEKYLAITEFGLKIKLTETVDDLVYRTKTSSDGKQTASITRQSLIDKGECKAEGDSDSLGAVTYFEDPNARDYMDTHTNQQMFPEAIKANSRYYIIIPSVQDTCYDPRTAAEDVQRLSGEGVSFLRNAELQLQ